MMIAIVVRRLICPSDEKRSSQWASLSSMYRRADDDAAVEMSRDLAMLVNEADRGAGPSAVDKIGSPRGVFRT
jgi:hypothetical protein